MQWSRYNRLFRSQRSEGYLYNILSNTLIKLDEPHYERLVGLGAGDAPGDPGDEAFTALLRDKKVLTSPGEEEKLLLARQYARHAASFETSSLGLTICPTLRCNFRCPYCFESSQKDCALMSAETADRLVAWIKEHKGLQALHVSWYGGEPLLAFDAICDLSERFKSLGLPYENAGLVTNGYLLDKEKIDRLNDLSITSIQITLDGSAEVHDARRMTAGGGPSFARIMDNLDALMNSDYAGRVNIRVNVDRSNMEGYRALRADLLDRFKGKKLSVYPGHVDADRSHSYGNDRVMTKEEWTAFTLELFHNEGDPPPEGLHPGANCDSLCVATYRNGYVVGPEGELYKCWADVGKPSMAVGGVHAENTITNPALLAEYYVGNDPYAAPACRDCDFLPICGGGCSNKRLRHRLEGETGFDPCSPYKERLVDYLNAYIDAYHMGEMAKAVFTPGKPKMESTGFRIISPEPKAEKCGKLTAAETA